MASESKRQPSASGGTGSTSTWPWRSLLLKVVGTIPLLLAIVLYFGPSFISEWEAYFGYGSVPSYDLPPTVMHQFRLYDMDGDGYLDPYEFERMMHRLSSGESQSFQTDNNFVSSPLFCCNLSLFVYIIADMKYFFFYT